MKMKQSENIKREVFNRVSKARKRKQDEVKSKYAYLNTVSSYEFQYEYLFAQARKICDIELELRLSPFKPLYTQYLEMITRSAFMYDNYIQINEFGIFEPDIERLRKLKRPTINFKNL